LPPHPDALKALQKISLEARKIGFALIDSKVNIQEVVDMFKKKTGRQAQNKAGTRGWIIYIDTYTA
jgi:hypothetical protein